MPFDQESNSKERDRGQARTKKRLSLDGVGEIRRDSTNLLSALLSPNHTHDDSYSPSIPQEPVFFSETQPIIPVTIEGSGDDTFDALMDTGATECYIDTRSSSKFADILQDHSKPIELRLFDGSPSSAGPLTSYVDLPLMFSTSQVPISTRFNVTKLQGADIVLGSRWMSKHRVSLDLASRKVTFLGNNLADDTPVPISTELKGVNQGLRRPSSKTSTYPNTIPILEPKYTFIEATSSPTNFSDI